MKAARPTPTTLHTRNVPKHLKAQFKAWCARRGYTMESTIIALMRQAIENDRPIPKARRGKGESAGAADVGG